MNDNVKADLDKLDMLRDQALCGPEETRDQSQQAYEELRSELLEHEQCEGCDDDTNTKELKMNDSEAEPTRPLDENRAKGFGWESNRNDENPKDLPWPEENETKE
jgi:hypothetical protein